MSKILKTIKLKDSKISEILSTDFEDGVTLVFDNDKIVFSGYHESDCCEAVWADFGVLKHYAEHLKDKYKSITIKGIKGLGFLLCFDAKYGRGEKVLISCYNEQNGYYSDELTLVIEHGKTKTEIDISDYKEDWID